MAEDWGAIEYLKDPENMRRLEAADVVFGVDVATAEKVLFYGREYFKRIVAEGTAAPGLIVEIPIVFESDEYEMLAGACVALKGRHDLDEGEPEMGGEAG
jgi:hypothetical protein